MESRERVVLEASLHVNQNDQNENLYCVLY